MGAKWVLGPFHAWQTAGLNASKKPLMLPGRRRAGLNASKKPLMWPGRRRKAMDMALVPGRAGA